MKNTEAWAPTKFIKDKRGRFIGTHIQQAIGPVYEKHVKAFSRGSLLDLGCGSVPLYLFYKDQVTNVTCVDWSNSRHNKSYLDHEFDLNAPIPLSSELFNTIICSDVLEHIANPVQLMAEIARLLKPEGHLILTVPFYYWLHEVPHDYFRYTKFALEKFCRENNLQVVHLEAYGGIPEILTDILYKGYPYLNLPFKNAFQKVFGGTSKFFLRQKFFKKISRLTSVNFPLGYILVAKK